MPACSTRSNGWATQGHDVEILPVGRDGLVDLDLAPRGGRRRDRPRRRDAGQQRDRRDPAGRRDRSHRPRAAARLFFCDAVQGFGRVPMPPDACDMVAVSAHKIHGPKGIGALWVRDGVDARAPAPRRRPGRRHALRHLVAGLVRRLRRGGAPARRAARGDHDHVERFGAMARAADGGTGRSTAAETRAITAISTSAATASTPPG